MKAITIPEDELGAILLALADFIDQHGFNTSKGKAIDSKDICDTVAKDPDGTGEFTGPLIPFFHEVENGGFPSSRRLGQFFSGICGQVYRQERLRLARSSAGWFVEKLTADQMRQESARVARPAPRVHPPRRLPATLGLVFGECVRQFGTKFSNGKRLRTVDLARAIERREPPAQELWKHLVAATGHDNNTKTPSSRVVGYVLSRARAMPAEGWCICTNPGFWWIEQVDGRSDSVAEKVA